ncbi:MAG TPA: RNA methyltransferase [Candidatus Saccharibacteria bacterium]|nr:RNA methyltransferase [Candidatus Saccharibacteria bacterium]
MEQEVVVIVNNIRSTHNVGSIIRTAEGFGVSHVYFTGYTPYPTSKNDQRLPHISSKLNTQISKTALGADKTLPWSYHSDLVNLVNELRSESYEIIALEQNTGSISVEEYLPPKKVAIIIGNEVAGVDKSIIEKCDKILEIPMFGKKESFNVVQATAVILYQIKVVSRFKH